MQTGSRLLKSVPKANFYPKISFLMSKITQTKYFALNFNILCFLGCSRQQNHLHFVASACTHGVLSSQTGGCLSNYLTATPPGIQTALNLHQWASGSKNGSETKQNGCILACIQKGTARHYGSHAVFPHPTCHLWEHSGQYSPQA